MLLLSDQAFATAATGLVRKPDISVGRSIAQRGSEKGPLRHRSKLKVNVS